MNFFAPLKKYLSIDFEDRKSFDYAIPLVWGMHFCRARRFLLMILCSDKIYILSRTEQKFTAWQIDVNENIVNNISLRHFLFECTVK